MRRSFLEDIDHFAPELCLSAKGGLLARGAARREEHLKGLSEFRDRDVIR
jgi:hypothetical protein